MYATTQPDIHFSAVVPRYRSQTITKTGYTEQIELNENELQWVTFYLLSVVVSIVWAILTLFMQTHAKKKLFFGIEYGV